MKLAGLTLAATLLMLPALAAAQLGSTGNIEAQVPFQFMVGNTSVPAGTYIVKPAIQGSSMLAIENQKAKVHVAFIVSDEKANAGQSTCLVFHKYGEHYFLSGIRVPGGHTEWLSEGKLEAELRAQNASAAQRVTIAALR